MFVRFWTLEADNTGTLFDNPSDEIANRILGEIEIVARVTVENHTFTGWRMATQEKRVVINFIKQNCQLVSCNIQTLTEKPDAWHTLLIFEFDILTGKPVPDGQTKQLKLL